MINVLCLMGKSGSGKSTLAKELIKDDRFHFIKSYTTRKVRKNDPTDLETHIFVDEDFRKNFKEKIMVEYIHPQKKYHSWSSKSLFDNNKINVYVVDIDAFKELSLSNDYDVKGIYLNIPEKIREERYLKRNKEKEFPIDKHLSVDKLFFTSLDYNLKNFKIININEKTPSEIKDDVLKFIDNNY